MRYVKSKILVSFVLWVVSLFFNFVIFSIFVIKGVIIIFGDRFKLFKLISRVSRLKLNPRNNEFLETE